MTERGGDDGPGRGLSRGLSALIGDDAKVLSPPSEPQHVPVEFLRPSSFQPRRHFDETAIAALADSIRAKGVLQPLLVRRDPAVGGSYEIVAGERRWRAAQIAQLHEVPVIVRDLADREALEIVLVENVQREDLTPLEEAEGYKRLLDEFSPGLEDLAKTVGKSRSHVANMMRLLALPEAVKTMLDSGRLTAGHARALLAARDPAALAGEVAERGLNVRQTERLVRRERRRRTAATVADADTGALERGLSDRLGLQVKIRQRVRGGGRLEIRYRNLEQLDDIVRRLSGEDG